MTQMLLAIAPERLRQAIAAITGVEPGVIVLAAPPMRCGRCQELRSLFVNSNGSTICVVCAGPK